MERAPLVSVIVPTYKRADLLTRALRSVFRQTYRPIEIVVVDDNGSGTVEQREAEEVVSQQPESRGIIIKYVVNQENMGGALARNIGMDNAAGEYVAFLDDDDEYAPAKIQKQMDVLTDRPELALTYAFCTGVDDDSGQTKEYASIHRGNCLFEQMYHGCIAATSQWVCRKAALMAVGGFEKSPAKQESILLLKILASGGSIECIEEFLSIFHEHSGVRISNSGKELDGELQYSKLIESYCDRLTQRQKRSVRTAYNFRLFKLYIKRKLGAKALRCLLNCFRQSPFVAVQLIKAQIRFHIGAMRLHMDWPRTL